MNYDLLIALLLNTPYELLFGNYDDDEIETHLDLIDRIPPKEMAYILECEGYDWQNLRREHTSMLLPFFL